MTPSAIRVGGHVCIITASQLASNPRVVKEADALEAVGLKVSVIALTTMDSVDARDRQLLEHRSWRAKRLDVRSPIVRRGLRFRQLIARRSFAAVRLGALAREGHSPFVSLLARAARRVPADLYIAHYPAALIAAARAARRHGGLYAYDAEDFHPGDWPDERRYDVERELLTEVERAHLPGCAYVTAASPAIAEAYAERYGVTLPKVILNTFPADQAGPGATSLGSAVPRPSVYWFSQTVGPNRGLETALEAIALSKTRPHLYLRGEPIDGYAAALRSRASGLGIGDRLHLLPPAPPDEMAPLAALYDLGLASEVGGTMNRRLCLTNKLFTYLLAGVPPLLSDTPAQVAFARESGLDELVYPTDSPAGLASLLDRFLSAPALLAGARGRCWRMAQARYCWEVDAQGLVALVGSALAGTGGASKEGGRLNPSSHGDARLLQPVSGRRQSNF